MLVLGVSERWDEPPQVRMQPGTMWASRNLVFGAPILQKSYHVLSWDSGLVKVLLMLSSRLPNSAKCHGTLGEENGSLVTGALPHMSPWP